MPSEPQDIDRRITERLTALGLTANRAETLAGTSDTIRNLRRKGTKPNATSASKLAAVLETSVGWLLNGEGAAENADEAVPIVGYVGAGDAAHYYEVDNQGELDRAAIPPGVKQMPAQARKIQGRSMGGLLEGWLVFTAERQTGVPAAWIDEVCEVGLPDGRILVKRVRRSRLPDLYNLISVTEEPMLDEEVAWSAKVLGMAPR